MDLIIALIGWSGALLALLAYILLTNGRLQGQSRTYQIMNVTGAASFIVNSAWNHAYPSATLNTLSLAVGLYALARGDRRTTRGGKVAK